jgi:hypothetical protein
MTPHSHGLLISWAMITTFGSIRLVQSAPPSEQDLIPPYTIELERRVQPWCPGSCVTLIPFTATYKKDEYVLVFVGAHHLFTPQNSTTRAVDSGFAAAQPAIVIVEGFPAAMGENPPPLVEEARRRGTPAADDFARGEAMYAAGLALARGIPFVGGEPSREEQTQTLVREGYSPEDIFFAQLVGDLSQAFRAGDYANGSDPKLLNVYKFWSEATARDFKLVPMPFEDFAARYRVVYGVDITGDTNLVQHAEAGTSNPAALLMQARAVIRDKHLLATIENELALKKQVLVVYGGSHWTTLSRALQKRLGKPAIKPFPE